MILLQAVQDLFEFIAIENSYTQHTANATGSNNRFSRYLGESLIGQLSDLGFPRMELTVLPAGKIADYGSSQQDTLNVRVRVIDTLSDKYNFAEETTLLDNCKKALMQAVKYMLDTADEGSVPLLCAFDSNNINYQFIDKSTFDGKAVGCEIQIAFKQCMDWDTVSMGSFPPYSEADNVVYAHVFQTTANQAAYTISKLNNRYVRSVTLGNLPLTPAQYTKPLASSVFTLTDVPFGVDADVWVTIFYSKTNN